MRCCAARAIQREASPAVGRAKKPSTHRSRTSVENDKSRAREGDRVTPLRLPDPPLADERVLLRPWQVADLAVIELASRDPAITVGTSVPTPYSEAAGDAWLSRQHAQREQRTGISMAIADPRTGQALGYVGVSGLVWRHLRGSLGYWVTGAQRRGGLASAAVGQARLDPGAGAAAADLEQGQRAGDRGVQAGDLAGHWDADQHVAGLADQPVQAGALAADHHADGLVGQVELEQARFRPAVQPDAPQAGGAQALQSAGEVGDLGHGHVLERAGGGLHGRGGQRGAAVAGQDDPVAAGGLGAADQRAEVVRVLDAVEGQEERRLGAAERDGQQLVEPDRFELRDDGGNTLVGAGLGMGVQERARHCLHGHAVGGGQLQQVGEGAPLAGAGRHHDPLDAARTAERLDHRPASLDHHPARLGAQRVAAGLQPFAAARLLGGARGTASALGGRGSGPALLGGGAGSLRLALGPVRAAPGRPAAGAAYRARCHRGPPGRSSTRMPIALRRSRTMSAASKSRATLARSRSSSARSSTAGKVVTSGRSSSGVKPSREARSLKVASRTRSSAMAAALPRSALAISGLAAPTRSNSTASAAGTLMSSFSAATKRSAQSPSSIRGASVPGRSALAALTAKVDSRS